MLECKICGKNLFTNITFTNIFKLKYEIHKTCLKKLVFNLEELVIPIQENVIKYDYVFSELMEDLKTEYLWFEYMGILLEKQLKTKKWSIAIFYDERVELFIKNNNPYLLLNLSKNPILFLSLSEKNISLIEGL